MKGRPRPPSHPHPLFPTPTPSPLGPSFRLGNENRGVEPGRGSESHTFLGPGVASFQNPVPGLPGQVLLGWGLQMQLSRVAALSSEACLLETVPALLWHTCANGLRVITRLSELDISPFPLQMGP